jgi:hypothetical protein
VWNEPKVWNDITTQLRNITIEVCEREAELNHAFEPSLM